MGIRPLGGTERSPSGYMKMSPLGAGSVLNPAGTKHRRAVEGGPGLPIGVLEAEHGPRPAQGHHVHAQGVLQVGGDLAEHLVGLDHFDRRARPVQPQGLAEPGRCC